MLLAIEYKICNSLATVRDDAMMPLHCAARHESLPSFHMAALISLYAFSSAKLAMRVASAGFWAII